METARANHAAVRGSFKARPSGLAYRSKRADARSESLGLYRHLSEAFCQYTHDTPEAPFPTFLESLLFEHITAERAQGAR